jgi:hypothetical protein
MCYRKKKKLKKNIFINIFFQLYKSQLIFLVFQNFETLSFIDLNKPEKSEKIKFRHKTNFFYEKKYFVNME